MQVGLPEKRGHAWLATCPRVNQPPTPPPPPTPGPGYPTSAEEDQGLAAGAAQGGGMEQRAPLCAAIRLQERATLAGAVAYADGMLERSRPFIERMQQQGAPPYQDLMRPWSAETEAAGRGIIAELQRLGLL